MYLSTRKEVVHISTRKNPLTDYGKSIKKQLIELNQTQTWLINKLREKTDMFVDTSVLNKIMTGRLNSKPIMTAIDEIIKERSEK